MKFRKINVVSSKDNMEHTYTPQKIFELLNVKANGKYNNDGASNG